MRCLGVHFLQPGDVYRRPGEPWKVCLHVELGDQYMIVYFASLDGAIKRWSYFYTIDVELQ